MHASMAKNEGADREEIIAAVVLNLIILVLLMFLNAYLQPLTVLKVKSNKLSVQESALATSLV